MVYDDDDILQCWKPKISRSVAQNAKAQKSRFIAENIINRDFSRKTPNIAVYRGKHQISRYRAKYLPMLTGRFGEDFMRPPREVLVTLSFILRSCCYYMSLKHKIQQQFKDAPALCEASTCTDGTVIIINIPLP